MCGEIRRMKNGMDGDHGIVLVLGANEFFNQSPRIRRMLSSRFKLGAGQKLTAQEVEKIDHMLARRKKQLDDVVVPKPDVPHQEKQYA